MARWLGQLVVIVSGFIIPRLIGDQLGPTRLGIWDLAWSTVSYFRFLGLGLAGGLNRYVAVYTSRRDHEALAKAVSSTAILQLGFAILTLVIASLVAHFSPQLFNTISPSEERDTRALIALLGFSIATYMVAWPAKSLLTGLHLWATNAAITATGDVLILVGLVSALSMGGGIPSLGLVVFAAALITETIRVVMARRKCKQQVLKLSAIDGKMMRKMLVFGVKNNVASMPFLIILQTTAVILAATAGPAVLAQFARPMALFRIVRRFVTDYAMMLTPTAGSMQGLGRQDELQEFFLTSVRTSIAMSLPPMLVLAFYGDTVVRLWMGDSYVIPNLSLVMAAGFFLPFSQVAAMRILVGMNAHGKISLYSLAVSIIAFIACSVVAQRIGWDPVRAAIVAGIGLTAGLGVTTPVCACRLLGISLPQYINATFRVPILCNAVFAAVLLISRWFAKDDSAQWAAVSVLLGLIAVIPIYWRFIIGADLRAAAEKNIYRFWTSLRRRNNS